MSYHAIGVERWLPSNTDGGGGQVLIGHILNRAGHCRQTLALLYYFVVVCYNYYTSTQKSECILPCSVVLTVTSVEGPSPMMFFAITLNVYSVKGLSLLTTYMM